MEREDESKLIRTRVNRCKRRENRKYIKTTKIRGIYRTRKSKRKYENIH